jgi:hypothetical protein
VLDFVDKHLSDLERAGVITMTGNGDPQGIWLFDDHRNMDRARHWDFDPARVGRDEDGSMPRILAARIAKLHLANPVVWSGTCHSGAVQRVFVEATSSRPSAARRRPRSTSSSRSRAWRWRCSTRARRRCSCRSRPTTAGRSTSRASSRW